MRLIVSPLAGGVTFRRRILSYAAVLFLGSILGCWKGREPTVQELGVSLPKGAVFDRDHSEVESAVYRSKTSMDDLIAFFSKTIAIKKDTGVLQGMASANVGKNYLNITDISAKSSAGGWRSEISIQINQPLGGCSEPERSHYQRIQRIVPSRDTVWFVGDEKSGHVVYQKNDKTFKVSNSPPDKYMSGDLPGKGYIGGYGLVTPVGTLINGFAFQNGVLTDSSGKNYPLPPIADEEINKWSPDICYGIVALQPGEDVTVKAVQISGLHPQNQAGPFIVDQGKIWMGLAGGFSELQGSFGGVAVFDFAKRSWQILRHELLIENAISCLLPDGDVLWLGTIHYGEGGFSSYSGLVKYDRRAGQWTNFTCQTSPIASNVVFSLAKDGDVLWIATEQGISKFEPRSAHWETYRWAWENDRLKGLQPPSTPRAN